MKRTTLILIFVTLISPVFAQITTAVVYRSNAKDERVITFDGHQNRRVSGMGDVWVSVMESRIDDIYQSMKEPVYAPGYKPTPYDVTGKWTPKTPIILGVAYARKENKYPPRYTVTSLSKNYTAYMMSDENSAVEVVGMGINKSNLNEYRFRVIENDSTELIPWTTPTLEQKHGAKHTYGYLGKFYSPGKEVTVEVVNIKNYNNRDGIVLNWRSNLRPAIHGVVGFIHGKGANGVPLLSLNKKSKQSILLNPDSVQSINIILKDHQTVPYNIYWVQERSMFRATTDTICIGAGIRDSIFGFTSQYYMSDGKYRLLIYPIGTKDKNRESSIDFTVQGRSEYKKGYTVLQLLPYLLLALLAFGIYYLFNKRRVRNLGRQKEMANLKLGSVRAQLNPHFMFNALTSIQNLMNQHDAAGANHYLSKFANLTRQVLNATSKELISLEDELKIINDYLQIEQLRFGFIYSVDVDKSINVANTQVPAMLMQPFIENAAKHGIAGMLHAGKIDIAITKQENNLMFTIADNGKGFDAQANVSAGFGLKLGRERIALLNQIYKSQLIKLQIDSNATGTTIIITLTKWF
ncbi:sensor histidine kinase [Mucilaginibacter calamicampi]|uniref:Sensor histidine kinase n=1 Tax=Mucilaginibacter calamicampi TaxID=1302352 RepID=A0ABW2Z1B4_9SPHI